MQPVLEISAAEDFALWPVDENESYGYLVLNGEFTPAEVGTAVMRSATWNDFEPEGKHGQCPTDPLSAFLHGLLTYSPQEVRVTDTTAGTVFVQPGSCNGPVTHALAQLRLGRSA
ncbi:hypothetical protein ACFYY2_15570 [Streptomyces sp. NPDC001822]|uniref:hypothetical protein n=1 Tax=Streptomyces sp. NPDC001822 TaxID=3364614 RepID=UPI00369E15D6